MNNKSIERGQTFLDEHTAKSNNNAATVTKEINNKYDRTRMLQKQTSGIITPLSLPVIERAPGKVEAVGSDSSHSNKGGNTNAPTWPMPQPLTAKIEAEPYPVDALPDTIRAAVEEVGGFVKAPVPLVASSAIAALSLAIQAHYDVERASKLH